VFATDDPTDEISAAWAVKELLRQLLAAHGPTGKPARDRAPTDPLPRCCAVADMPETTRLAGTNREVVARDRSFLEPGYNRVIKQIKRVACGFRNQANYERRIMLHSATLRAA